MTAMAIESGLAMSAQLSMRASPGLIAFSHILGLSAVQLERLVEEELAENPALERTDTTGCPRCGSESRDCWCAGGPRLITNPEGSGDALVALPDGTSDAERLLHDLLLVVGPDDRRLAAYVTHSLDGRGFLPETPAEIARTLCVAQSRVERVIAALRKVGPLGVAAADVRECLLLQLDHLETRTPAPALVRQLVADHLDALALGKVGSVAASLGVGRSDVEAALRFVRAHLRPYVTFEASGSATSGAGPLADVVIYERADAPGEYRVEVVGRARRSVALDPFYARLAARLRSDAPGNVGPSEREQILASVARARAFLNRLGQREVTVRTVAEAVVDRQRAFLRSGPVAHLPLTRTEVAQQLGLHESTVSRATAGKTVRLPDGSVVPFAAFFGGASSAQAVLRELVAAEATPLSDSQLSGELRSRGFDVARRTVAKYRGELGIPSCVLR